MEEYELSLMTQKQKDRHMHMQSKMAKIRNRVLRRLFWESETRSFAKWRRYVKDNKTLRHVIHRVQNKTKRRMFDNWTDWIIDGANADDECEAFAAKDARVLRLSTSAYARMIAEDLPLLPPGVHPSIDSEVAAIGVRLVRAFGAKAGLGATKNYSSKIAASVHELEEAEEDAYRSKALFASHCDAVFKMEDEIAEQQRQVAEWDFRCHQSDDEIHAFWHSGDGSSKGKLADALTNLRTVTKKDWYAIRGMAVIPPLVEKVMQFALLLLGLETGDSVKDRLLATQLTLDSEGAKLVGEVDALLHKYDSWLIFLIDHRFDMHERCKDSEMLDRVDDMYIKDRNLLPTNSRILDQSVAAAKLCKWCRATYRYLRADTNLIAVRERIKVDEMARDKAAKVVNNLRVELAALTTLRDKESVKFLEKLLKVTSS